MKDPNDFYSEEDYKKYFMHHFSGLAMQGILSNLSMHNCPYITDGKLVTKLIASDAIAIADELLKQLEENEKL